MTEQIGLEAVLNDANFQAGLKSYISGVGQMDSVTATASGKMSTQFMGLGDSVIKFAGLMSGVAVAGIAAFTGAVAGFVGGGISLAADLESQMDAIRAISGASISDMEQLSALSTDLGIDPNLKVSALEAAEAIEMLASNGLTVEQILDGAARGAVLLANATGGTFAQSATIATDVMNLWGISAEEMTTAVDGISSVVVASKFSIEDYALALAQGGGVAATLGVEFDDFNTSIAAISPLFSSGADAGTSFKTFLSRMVPASNTAEAAMRELGIITEDGANQFFDAEGNMKSMSEIAGVLATATGDLSEEQLNQTLSTIFGSDAIRAAAGIAKIGAEGFTELQGVMGQTDAAEQAAIRMDNFKGSMEILGGVIETLKLRIGNAFLPMITEMARAFTSFVDKNGDAIIAFFDNFVTAIESLIPAFERSGSIILTFGEFLDNFVPEATMNKIWDLLFAVREFGLTVQEFVITHWEEFRGAIMAVGAVFASAAIASVLATIGAAIAALASPIFLLIGAAALLGAAWAGNWGGIRDVITDVWQNNILPALTELWNWLQVAIPIAIQTMSDFWTNTLKPALETVWAFIVGSVIPAIGNVVTWLQVNLPIAIQAASDFWTNVLKPALDTVWAFIVDSLIPTLTDVFDWLSVKLTEALQKLSDFWTNTLLPAITSVWAWLDGTLFPFFEAFNDLLKLGLVVILGTLEEAWKRLKPPLSSVFDLFRDVAEKVDGPLKTALTWMKDTILPPIEAAFYGISAALQAATTWMNNLIAAVTSFVPPEIITPGSPTPFEIGFVGIGEAVKAVTADLQKLNTSMSVGANFPQPPTANRFLNPILPQSPASIGGDTDSTTVNNYRNYSLTAQTTLTNAQLRNQFAMMELLDA